MVRFFCVLISLVWSCDARSVRGYSTPPLSPGAVQPPGLSYSAHWEALGCPLRLLTTSEISTTGPLRGRGFCPGSHRPRARVPLVVWAWDFCDMRVLYRGFLAPALNCFRCAICNYLSRNGCPLSVRGHSTHPLSRFISHLILASPAVSQPTNRQTFPAFTKH